MMTDGSILVIIEQYIRRIGELDDDFEINRDMTIREDIGIDSLAQIDLIVNIERHFGIMIPEAAIADVKTVNDLLMLVQAEATQ